MASAGLTLTSSNGSLYLVYNEHRNGGWRSQWSITVQEELSVFDRAELGAWGEDGSLWGLHLDGAQLLRLGTEGEFIARFRRTDPAVPWHGYPAQPSTQHRQDFPPDQVVNMWVDMGLLSRPRQRRLQQGRWRL